MYTFDMGTFEETETYYQYYTDGEDTLIGGNTYERVRIYFSTGYKGSFRNESGVVYYIEEEDSIEQILYDFTLNVGDTMPDTYNEMGIDDADIVTIVDTLVLFGIPHRRIRFTGEYAWIDGIGCTQGLFASVEAPLSPPGIGVSYNLECMSKSDSVKWSGDYWAEYVGSCSLLDIQTSEKKPAEILGHYDLMGRPIKEPKGMVVTIYSDGRKELTYYVED